MSQHTPGPWRLTGPDTFGDFTVQPPDEALAIAAVVNGEMRRMGGEGAVTGANAYLIAAAPDLYDALVNVMASFGPGTMSHDVYFAANAALAKARGELLEPFDGTKDHL